jgi:hypothetical protein
MGQPAKDRESAKDQERARESLIAQAKTNSTVAQALAVFEAASARAPFVPTSPPDFQFSTGANS